MKGISIFLAAAISVHAQVFKENLPAPVEERAPLPTLFKRDQHKEPCQEVSASWAAAGPKATGTTNKAGEAIIPAQVAYACLQSVPVDKDGDLQQIQELKQMLQFQSTLTWLKQGVPGNIAPVDLMGKLDEMADKLKQGGIKSEYDFQLGIRQLFISTGDFHLRWRADVLDPLVFSRAGGQLTSLSKDGVSFPDIYLASDVVSMQKKQNATTFSQISSIKTINGVEATKYLQNVSSQSQYGNPDARYNDLFVNIPLISSSGPSGHTGSFYQDGLYDGATTELVFNNGTKQSLQNIATIGLDYDFGDVVDGKSFFEAFCSGGDVVFDEEGDTVSTTRSSATRTSTTKSSATHSSKTKSSDIHTPTKKSTASTAKPTAPVSKRDASSSTSRSKDLPSALVPSSKSSSKSALMSSTKTASSSSKSTSSSSATPSVLYYPKAEFVSKSKSFQGYYLNNSGYDDVAVLAVPDFSPVSGKEDEDGLIEVQELLRTFFSQAIDKKKNKLVIDLRGNGGGFIDMGFELFKQLFPTVEPYGGARYRAHDAYKILAAALAATDANATMKQLDIETYETAEYSTFVWNNVLDVDHKDFKSFDNYYGPNTINNDQFTSIFRYNFSNHIGGHTMSPGFNLTGYAPEPTPTQPFKPENIVLVQDGLCGSTCAIFSELMREQGHVQTIFIGGLPQAGPAQGVGGSKGSQVLDMSLIMQFMKAAVHTTQEFYGKEAAQVMNSTAVGALAAGTQLVKRSSHDSSSSPISGAVNSLNAQRQGDKTDTPLQFIVEQSDCRLFDTIESFLDPVLLWKRAVDAKWGEGKCVEGSQGDKTAISVVDGKAFNKQPGALPPKAPSAAPKGVRIEGALVGIVAVMVGMCLL